jgi:hypothetical protein
MQKEKDNVKALAKENDHKEKEYKTFDDYSKKDIEGTTSHIGFEKTEYEHFTSPVPEPTSVAMFIAGIALFATIIKVRTNKNR